MNKSIITAGYHLLLLRLKTIRWEKGLSQKDLATRLSKPQSFVSRVERGERRIDVIELRQYCAALEVPFVDFVQELDAEIRTRGINNG